jgi:hypothetical protein
MFTPIATIKAHSPLIVRFSRDVDSPAMDVPDPEKVAAGDSMILFSPPPGVTITIEHGATKSD